MEFVQPKDLHYKVVAINLTRDFSAKILKYEIEKLTPLVGADIFKADGSFKKKFEYDRYENNLMKGTLEDGTYYDCHYHYDNSYHSFKIKVRVCVVHPVNNKHNGTATIYEDCTFYPFNVNEGKLSVPENRDYSYLEKRLDVDTLMRDLQKVRLAAEQYDKAYNLIPHEVRDIMRVKRLDS